MSHALIELFGPLAASLALAFVMVEAATAVARARRDAARVKVVALSAPRRPR